MVMNGNIFHDAMGGEDIGWCWPATSSTPVSRDSPMLGPHATVTAIEK
jgi:hypothetical protein